MATAAFARAGETAGKRVTAIVPQYAEPSASIERALRGLLWQRRAPDEVVLVDDASPVPPRITPDIAERVRVLTLPRNCGVSAARNFAAQRTQSDYILFANCDVVLADDWVETAIAFMDDHPRAGAVSGAIVPRVGPSAVRRWRLQHIETKVHRARPPGPVEVTWIVGHAMFVRRSAFAMIGGFDPRFRRAGDDPDLCARLRAAGFAIHHHPGLLAESYEPATIDAMARKSVRNSGWNLRLGCEPCAAVRPLRPVPASMAALRLLADHASRDFVRRRFALLPVDLAVAGRSLGLILRAWRGSAATRTGAVRP